MLFDYQSVHYVVRAAREMTVGQVVIPAGTPCEIQVRTLLQHAYSEVTHDTIYKSKVEASTETKRSIAKSMALIEASDDYFSEVLRQSTKEIEADRSLSNQMGCAYSKLESDVLMMEPAEDRNRCDAANLLRHAKIRSIFIQ
jgi:ppGpp synthetase/RelA/SpoT-type nucleotidyltranferase